MEAHSRSQKKLGFKIQESYIVLQTNGLRFLVESLRGIRTVASDHVTEAPPPPARDAKWNGALRAQALFKEETQRKDGPKFVCDKFIKHGCTDDVQLKLPVKQFGFPEKEATWQFASSLLKEALRKYCLQKKIKLPALKREGVLFSDQVKKRVPDQKAALSRMGTKAAKKTG